MQRRGTELILDADALIKLNAVGVLAYVVEAFDCVVPQAVYREVVIDGLAKHYEDAGVIKGIVDGTVVVAEPVQGDDLGVRLGAGETEIFSLLSHHPDAVVISDDHRFLTVLAARTVSSLTPADMLFVLQGRRVISKEHAISALEAMRPMISSASYSAARAQLFQGEDHGQN